MIAQIIRRNFVRSVIASGVTTIIAGCSGIPDAPDLRIRNRDIQVHEIHVTVDFEGDTIINDTVTVGSNEQTTVDSIFEETGTYEITGSIETGESNAEIIKIETTERDHKYHLTVHEEPSHVENELITIDRIAP